MNYDYEIEKHYHPENFMLDDDIADYLHDQEEPKKYAKTKTNNKKN